MPQTANLFANFKNSAGKNVRAGVDPQNAELTSARHGKYFQASYGGLTGRANNQAGVTTSVALATTCVGFTLSNPAGSGKILVPQKASFLVSVAAAAAQQVGLYGGFAAGGITAHTTPLTILDNYLGGSVADLVAKADAACTLVGTPAWLKWLAEAPATATLFSGDFDLEGEFIIPPGGYIGIGTLIAGGASGFFGGMSWEELPI